MKWHFVFAASLANLIQSLRKVGLVDHLNETFSKPILPHKQVMQKSRKRKLFHCELGAHWAPPIVNYII